ncbi:MAG: VWA domain-containing protein [Verrucomicrobiota bacterium]
MSEFLTQFHFLRPMAFLLLVPVVLIWWFWRKQTDPLRGWKQQIAPELLKALLVGKPSSRLAPARWLLIGWMLMVVLIAGPTWRLEPSPFAEDASPLLVLLKSDVSMDTSDPAPSRMHRAELKIADLAELRKGQPLGLIAYAGSAHLVLPPTRDTAVVAEMAGEITPEIMPVSGDRLDLALREAARVLGKAGAGGSIVVFADLVNTDPASLRELSSEFAYPIQFLQITGADSPSEETVRAAAKVFRAPVERMRVDDDDVASLVRRASATPVSQEGNETERWEESGYWLLPAVGILLLAAFRRRETEEVSG